MSTNMKMESIQCTVMGCNCDCFCPGKSRLRVCDSCEHGWVVHALDKMAYRTPAHQVSGQSVEVVQPNIVFDIASLMLYGAHATPIRLKILLDRLFSVVQHDEVLQVLHSFGWSYEDYARGYILHDSTGRVLDKWSIATYEEEQLILQQFLRFGETKAIAQELISRDGWDQPRPSGAHCLLTSRTESDIKKFIERSNVGMQSFIKGYDAAQQLLSRTFMYPHLTTAAGFARLLTPTILHNLSPAVGKPGLPSPAATAAPPNIINPLSRSPLRSLQTMEPFDYRKESIASPKASPAIPTDAAASSKQLDGRTLMNLAVGASGQPTAIPTIAGPHLMMVKSEALDDMSVKGGAMEVQQMRDCTQADGAINYSIKDMRVSASVAPLIFNNPSASVAAAQTSIAAAAAASNPNSSIFAHQKLKHLRKSSNPMKRPWQPTPGYGGTLISPSGKKRVLCTACHKTFCDKGALKIHYSAVHLKEMHRCTVDGCTMMFSSRRSRNRHSANPNPKLHMPQTVRRKLPDNLISSNQEDEDDDDDEAAKGVYSPRPLSHDEGSCGGTGVLLGGGGGLPGNGFVQRPQPVVLDVMSDSSEGDPAALAENLTQPHAAFPLGATPRFFLNPGLPVVSLPPQVLVEQPRFNHAALAMALPVLAMEQQKAPTTEEGSRKAEEPKQCHDLVPEVGQCRSSSKRKSAVPTRCSLQTDEIVSDNSGDELSPEEKRPCPGTNHLLDGFEGSSSADACAPDPLTSDDKVRTEKDLDMSVRGGESNSGTEPLTVCEVQEPVDGGRGDGSQLDNIIRHRSPIPASEVVDEGRGLPGPRTSTPGPCVRTSESHAITQSVCTTTVSPSIDNLPLNMVHPSSPQNSSMSESLSMASGDYDERHLLARERSKGCAAFVLESPVRSRDSSSEVNDSGVADLKCIDEADMDRKCQTCNKSFQTHFRSSADAAAGPHSKSSHVCMVEGCNAAFPSKRSRDRHSANLNLHRRLLSTTPHPSSSTENAKGSGQDAPCDVSSSSIVSDRRGGGLGGLGGRGVDGSDDTESPCVVLNLSKNVHGSPERRASHDSDEGSAGITCGVVVQERENESSSVALLPPLPLPLTSSFQPPNSMEVDDSQSGDSPVLAVSSDATGCVVCHICQDPFKDNLALKEHQERAHPKEMYRCTIGGCDKIFSTRKSRNRHSQNENLHKHLIVTPGAPVATVARQLAL